ncbi:hypothetical protein BP5796_06354 [Coleophoma crateriformis]|uniref:Uncharacterized protein n=1 Tax=Coleophoma crateriformis TaxID=565419 RepID=A0A3D8RWP4_9HELO|nr:hypothetical protein BP5796_06354 [Coleophoma crateriformis]
MGVVSAVLLVLITILLPPIGVYIVAGCGADLLINICLTLLGSVISRAPNFPLAWLTAHPDIFPATSTLSISNMSTMTAGNKLARAALLRLALRGSTATMFRVADKDMEPSSNPRSNLHDDGGDGFFDDGRANQLIEGDIVPDMEVTVLGRLFCGHREDKHWHWFLT